jgi:hypothetical protein
VIGPRIFQWDFSTLKEFHFSERRYLEFRFECFNCSNRVNYNDPGTSMGSSTINASTGIVNPGSGAFGLINSIRPGLFNRQLQFALKFIF